VILALVEQTTQRGAGLHETCNVLGLSARTVQRWRQNPDGDDGRRTAPRHPPNALTPEERKQLVRLATSEKYRNLSVRQLVPRLADEDVYVASESSFYRVLHAEGLMAHRGHTRPRSGRSKPRTHVATGPCQVWSWDITYLRAPVRGTFYYLYLLLDIWSRKIVGYAVHDTECMLHASELAEVTCAAENVGDGELVLHADNGGPMKGATMLATLERLGVAASFSRPGVSDDNALCEALFRTLKYRPGYPRQPFPSLEAARAWVDAFVAWYNGAHLHSGIRFVTPNDRHQHRDAAILAKRAALYTRARKANPARWSTNIRNWQPIGSVTLNPLREVSAA
jgi:putative transposase